MGDSLAHVHHWLLPPANGPTTVARCRDCGAVQEMPNTWEECLRRQGKAVNWAELEGHLNYLRDQRLKQPKPY